MLLGFTSAVSAISEAVKSCFDFASTTKAHQSETEIIKDVKHSNKAVDAAERALLIADKYKSVMSLKDRLKYLRWCRVFWKYN